MNNRITEPKARFFEKQVKYGSEIKNSDYTSMCVWFNTKLHLKPYIR